MNTISINGIDYAPVEEIKAEPPKVSSGRAIIVVDRGWIFAGDVARSEGRIYLTNAVWVFKWEGCGFSKVVEDAKNADIRPIADVEIPENTEIFCVPVPKDWGL